MTDLIQRDAAIDYAMNVAVFSPRASQSEINAAVLVLARVDTALRAIPAIDLAAIREAALREALKAIADLPHGKNEDVMEGDERSYRAILALIGEKK